MHVETCAQVIRAPLFMRFCTTLRLPPLVFSMSLFFYHLHSCLQSLMWFKPAHHSRWLLQHLSGFGARAQGRANAAC